MITIEKNFLNSLQNLSMNKVKGQLIPKMFLLKITYLSPVAPRIEYHMLFSPILSSLTYSFGPLVVH